jgi:hypothetical protein
MARAQQRLLNPSASLGLILSTSLSGAAAIPFAAVIRCTGQGRQTNSEQVVAGHALLGGVQAGLRAAGSFHQVQGRHQRLLRSVLPVHGARPGHQVSYCGAAHRPT